MANVISGHAAGLAGAGGIVTLSSEQPEVKQQLSEEHLMDVDVKRHQRATSDVMECMAAGPVAKGAIIGTAIMH